jgi:NAD(P)-dependent dehydrogenase (short-subunit alcohol dehydrogenase family)
MQLNTVRAIVTGGVSGLGLAVAKHLVAHGGKVALFDVNDEKGAAAVAGLGEANARYFKTDVSNEAGVSANVEAASTARASWVPAACSARTARCRCRSSRPR